MIATRNQDKKKSKGRPTVADARRLSKAVTVKFSKIDYETLRTKSRKANRRLAEYIRESALQSEVVQPRTEADLKEYRTLVGMANNLDQLAKLSHRAAELGYILEISPECENYAAEKCLSSGGSARDIRRFAEQEIEDILCDNILAGCDRNLRLSIREGRPVICAADMSGVQ